MAEVRYIRFHDLRHTFATLMLEQGVELVTIKDLLGHAQLHVTANIYASSRELHRVGEKSLVARSGPTPPRSFRGLGIAVAVAWQHASAGGWGTYAADVSRRTRRQDASPRRQSMELVRSGARGEDSRLMTDAEFARDWSDLLDRLDRHPSSGQLSPDTATLPDLMDTYRVPGLSIAVGGDDGQVWAAGYGSTGAAEPTPVNLHTAFQACSISKHVAAFGALRLTADGVLDLDTDINEYLTSWRLPASGGWRASVTLRQLLAHTAGLSSNWFRGYGVDEPIPSLVQTLQGDAPANTPPVRSSLLPGSRFRYSGSHYAVLQQLMVDATGSRFDELMHALVLKPLAMADSSFDQQFPHQRPQLVALGHHIAGTPVPGGWRTIPEMAGAGLWSTPTDLLRLELEIARAATGKSQLLDQNPATQMLTPQLPDGAYGLGTQIHDSTDHRRFGHTGLNVGYNCFSFAWPEASAAVAVMTNSDDAREVLSSILAAADRQYATDIKATPLADVTGRYLLQDNYPIDIAAADGRLTLTAAGQPPALLLPLQNGLYRHPGLDLEIRFHRTPDQPPYTMELHQEGITQTATRSASAPTELP